MWIWTNSCKHLCTKLLPANFYSWADELSPFASASILFKCEHIVKEDHFVHSEIYEMEMECVRKSDYPWEAVRSLFKRG